MSQRLKAALSWPRFSVSAGDPDEVVPRAVDGKSWPFFDVPPPFSPSVARGVFHEDARAASVNVMKFWPP